MHLNGDRSAINKEKIIDCICPNEACGGVSFWRPKILRRFVLEGIQMKATAEGNFHV